MKILKGKAESNWKQYAEKTKKKKDHKHEIKTINDERNLQPSSIASSKTTNTRSASKFAKALSKNVTYWCFNLQNY